MLRQNGDPTLEDLTWNARAWDGEQAYFDTKLHDVLLAIGIGDVNRVKYGLSVAMSLRPFYIWATEMFMTRLRPMDAIPRQAM
jgi:hypothetical protein